MNIRMQKVLFFCMWINLFISCAVSQQSSMNQVVVKNEITVHSKLVEVDNLMRIYLVDEKNKLINYKPDLTEQYRYANNRSGYVTSVDVSNPLRIIVFYDDFNQIKILDNTLSIIHEMNLSSTFSDITACSASNDGNLWVFDPTQFKLLKINDRSQTLIESANVADFGMTNIQISAIKEKSNYVILMDRKNGFYIFDNLGQYMYHFHATNIVSFQFDGSQIIYYNKEGLNVFNVVNKENQTISVPLELQQDDLQYVLLRSENYFAVYKTRVKVLPLK